MGSLGKSDRPFSRAPVDGPHPPALHDQVGHLDHRCVFHHMLNLGRAGVPVKGQNRAIVDLRPSAGSPFGPKSAIAELAPCAQAGSGPSRYRCTSSDNA